MSNKRTVLVAGATGAQGGSVANALFDHGHKVIAMTRNSQSPAASKLVERGADLKVGDFADPASLRIAAKGADTAFIMTTPNETGPESEVAQGIAMIDALRDAGVGHIVFSSVGGADQATGIPHFDSKYKVEEYLVNSGVPFSVIRPAYFMENLVSPWSLPKLQEGNIAAALPADRKLQQVAVRNIGEFAAALINRRQSVFGKSYDIAGDELTMSDLVRQVSDASGRQITYQGFPVEALKTQNEDLGLMFEWFDNVGYSADITSLKRDFPEVNWLNYSDWLNQQDWSILNNSDAA